MPVPSGTLVKNCVVKLASVHCVFAAPFDGVDAEQPRRVRRGQEVHLQRVGPGVPRHGDPGPDVGIEEVVGGQRAPRIDDRRCRGRCRRRCSWAGWAASRSRDPGNQCPGGAGSRTITRRTFQAAMMSLGGLSLTTLTSIDPDVVPADMISGVPGGLLVDRTTPARAPPARRPSRAQDKSASSYGCLSCMWEPGGRDDGAPGLPSTRRAEPRGGDRRPLFPVDHPGSRRRCASRSLRGTARTIVTDSRADVDGPAKSSGSMAPSTTSTSVGFIGDRRRRGRQPPAARPDLGAVEVKSAVFTAPSPFMS